MTALDTNVLIALWDEDLRVSSVARRGLDAARERGGLLVCGPVYAELRAGPERTDAFLDTFFQATAIEVDWNFPEGLWRAAGAGFQRHGSGRMRRPRRILADFLITAHAAWRCGQLLTFDSGLRSLAVAGLEVVVL